MITTTRQPLTGPRTWPAYAAAAWLVAFVGWHVPLSLGWNPLHGDGMTGAAFHTYNLTLICMAGIGAVVVLATVRPWGRRFPRWLLLTPLVVGSVLLVLRGVPGFVEFVLQVTGVAPAGLVGLLDPDVAAPTGRELWAGYAINVYFFLGAVLLVPATYRFWRLDRGNAVAATGSDRSLWES
jgi:hypothetical protein